MVALMTIEKHLSVIRKKAEHHAELYSGFNLRRFLAWIEGHHPSWYAFNSGRSIEELNKARRKAERFSRFVSRAS